MATEKQTAANLKNAKKSHGPTSQEGLDAIKLNAWRHGMAVKHHQTFSFLLDEIPEKFDELLKSLHDEHKPETETESLLVRHLAESEWLRARALRYQADCLSASRGFKINDLPLFIRYHATHTRAFYKSLTELQNIRKQKQNAQIGFESQELEKAAEIRAAETLKIRNDAQNLKREAFLWRKEVFQTKNTTAPSPEKLQRAA